MSISWVDDGRFTHSTKVIAVVDVVESVRLMELDPEDFIDRWHRFVGFVHEFLASESGRMHKSLGDGLMLEFAEPQGCIRTALAMQGWFSEANAGLPPEQHVHLRIGAHIAHFVADQYDIYGPDVNLAARIASLAGPAEIIVTAALRERLRDAAFVDAHDLGHCHLKHVKEPVHVFRVGEAGVAPVIPAQAGPAQQLQPRIAVLPLNLNGDPIDDVTGEAITDDIVSGLTNSDVLQLASRLVVAHVPATDPSLEAARRIAGARYVLTGRVHLLATRLSLHLELADADTGQIVWAHSFHGVAPDGEGLDPRLLAHVLEALQSEVIRHEVDRARDRALHTLPSATLLLGAIGLMHRLTPADSEQARAMLEHLGERWRRYPSTASWLAHLHVLRLQQGIGSATQEQSLALEHSGQALDFDPTSPHSLAVRGWALLHAGLDVEGAAEAIDQALLLRPDHPFALLCRAEWLAMQRHGVSARALVQRAALCCPVPPLMFLHDYVEGLAAMVLDDAELAAERARHALRRNPRYVPAYTLLMVAHVFRRDLVEARRTLHKLQPIHPGFSVAGWRASFAGDPVLVDRFSEALLRARVRPN